MQVREFAPLGPGQGFWVLAGCGVRSIPWVGWPHRLVRTVGAEEIKVPTSCPYDYHRLGVRVLRTVRALRSAHRRTDGEPGAQSRMGLSGFEARLRTERNES